MKALAISPEKDIIEIILNYLEKSDKDYSSNLVVFPGKRPSHFLRKKIAEKEGSSFLPPTVFSMDEFVDNVYEKIIGPKKKIETIDAVAILYQIHKSFKSPIGKESFIDPDTFFQLGIKVFNDLEELYIEKVEPRMVKDIDDIIDIKIPQNTSKRIQFLSYFYDAFYKYLKEKDYSTRSSRYIDVALNIEKFNFDSFRKIIFAGFFGLTKSERLIFNFLKNRNDTIFLFHEGPGIEEAFSDLNIEKEEIKTKPNIYLYKSPDSHGQVFGIGSILKYKIEGGERLDEKTVIVLPSTDTMFPLIHHGINQLSPNNFNVSVGYPLERTPLFGLFNNLMKLIISMDERKVYVPYYLDFILHPYIKNIYFNGKAEITRIIFHTIEDTLTEEGSKKFLSLDEIEEDGRILNFLSKRIDLEENINFEMVKQHLKMIHENTIKKFLSLKDIGDFAEKLMGLIEFIYRESTAKLHLFFYPYCESFLEQLHQISRSLIKDIKFENIGSYFNLVKHVLKTAYVPFHGTPIKGVQILGFLETRNLRFDNVFFLDLNEGVFPAIKKEDSLIPLKIREAIGLPTYQDREKLILYYFDTLINGAKEVHLFYIENDNKERSRFIERILWEKEMEEKTIDERKFINTIQYFVTLRDKKPRAVEKTEDLIKFLKNFSFSASSIDTYLSCQLAFYYKYILGLKERKTISEELEREEVGAFIHKVLFKYFNVLRGGVLSEEDMDLNRLESIIDKIFEEQFGKDLSAEFFLLKKQTERHLKDFIKYYQIPVLKKVATQIIGLEECLTVEKNSFKLISRIDRIEMRGKRITIIDYKTSGDRKRLSINFNKIDFENREGWKDAISTLQLPFYLITYSQFKKIKPEEIDCIFLILGRNLIDKSIEIPLFDDESNREIRYSLIHEIIFKLLSEIVDISKPFLPSYNQNETCPNCEYRNVCTN